jgi:hypothetical protein
MQHFLGTIFAVLFLWTFRYRQQERTLILIRNIYHGAKMFCKPCSKTTLQNSGFSIDNSVRIYGSDNKARESLAQYIARAPVSLEKLKYEPFHGKVLFKTPKYNDFFKENFKSFDVLDFIALVTAHIPPKHKQYIRRYGRL